MLMKSADDKSKRLELLENLQRSTVLDASQQNWLREQLMRLRKGIQGEHEAAHYLNSWYKDSQNHVVLHDLRFVIDGDVTQIDHLIINRAFDFFLLETKNFAGNLVINEHAEFTVEYENSRFGIPSPIEQSRRHERALCKLLARLEISGRTQKLPDFHHVVLMHPKAIIKRPPTKVFDTSNVIKADQFDKWRSQFVDKLGTLSLLTSMLNFRSPETLKEWGEKLKRQHQPDDPLWLPEWMNPKKGITPVECIVHPPQATSPRLVETTKIAAATGDQVAPRLFCAKCKKNITDTVANFCFTRKSRFNGRAYCMEHQKDFN